MICIIDYGIGNIQAFLNVYNRLGIDAKRAKNENDLKYATHLILPGVGHFDHAINKFNQSKIKKKLEELVLNSNIPLLGICVGMQMLAEGSDEGVLPGLGWIPGRVRRFPEKDKSSNTPLPHMGWNNINITKENILLTSLEQKFTQFYFLHSYYFDAGNFKKNILALSNYGINFTSIVSHKNIYGVQFHPEKSHKWGEQLLKNFSKIKNA